jgi:hypothetical protein
VEEPARKPHRVNDRYCDTSPGEALDLAVEEPHVEPSVVRDEGRVAREREKAADCELGAWRSP